jgi:hypothetical protein
MLLTLSLPAQIFIENQSPLEFPFEQVSNSTVNFHQFNENASEDVLITGQNSAGEKITHVFFNNESGRFHAARTLETSLPGVTNGAIAIKDKGSFNGEFILITGQSDSGKIAKLYENHWFDPFDEVEGTPFEGVSHGAVALADVNGDNITDVLITGRNSQEVPISRLYIKTEPFYDSVYIEPTGLSLPNVELGAVAFSDIDNDGDSDLMITGRNIDEDLVAKLYVNDGNGNLTEVSDTPFEGVENGDIRFQDFDGDEDPDLLVVGQGDDGPIAKLYINDGSGNFGELQDTPFVGIAYSNIATADVDQDEDLDILLSGATSNGSPLTALYKNDGQAGFTIAMDLLLDHLSMGANDFSDINDDGSPDLLISGINAAGEKVTKVFVNDGNGNFDNAPKPSFEGYIGGSISLFDIDGDGDEDFLLSGMNSMEITPTVFNDDIRLYRNNGNGLFKEVYDNPFIELIHSTSTHADVDADGDLDLFITGEHPSESGTFTSIVGGLYINDGTGHFSEKQGWELDWMVCCGAVEFEDVDNDGDPDLMITGNLDGYFPSGEKIAKLLINDGEGNFAEAMNTPFQGLDRSSLAFADMDNDGDQDLLLTGRSEGNNQQDSLACFLYFNNGDGTFSEITDHTFFPVENGDIDFADVDNDGDDDVLISGRFNGNFISNLYFNDGAGQFTIQSDSPFSHIARPSQEFTDLDNDNDQDVIITSFSSWSGSTQVYINDGIGNFSSPQEVQIDPETHGGLIGISDFQSDGSPDIIITGRTPEGGLTTTIYFNEGIFYGFLPSDTLFCTADTTVTVSGGTPNGGVYSGPGVTDNGNGQTFTLDTGELPIGTHSITYTRDDQEVITEITIGEPPEVTLGEIGPFFIDQGDQFLNSGLPEGGTYSGMGVVDGFFSPQTAGFGDHTITYTYTTPTGCEGTDSIKVLVTQQLAAYNSCSGAESINDFLGQEVDVTILSEIYNNFGYNSIDDPMSGFECFDDGSLDRTIWFTFTGDGNTYSIKTGSGTALIHNTQIAIYTGDSCDDLESVVCNEDEDLENGLLNASVEIATEAGRTYWMLVDSWVNRSMNPDNEFYLVFTNLFPNSTTNITRSSYRVFPNPTTGLVQFDGFTPESVSVMDSMGRLIKSQPSASTSLNLHDLPAGMYFLKIKHNETWYSARVVKE